MAWQSDDLEQTCCPILFESHQHQSSTLLNPSQVHGQFRRVTVLVAFTVDSFLVFLSGQNLLVANFCGFKFADLFFLSVNIFFIAGTLLKFYYLHEWLL